MLAWGLLSLAYVRVGYRGWEPCAVLGEQQVLSG